MSGTTIDLHAVDELCRLTRAAQRLGCTVRLSGATHELRELLDLAGVSGLILDDPPDPDPDESDLP